MHALAGCVAVNRHDARIAHAADLNRRTVVSNVGMADSPPGSRHVGWLVHRADNVKRCREAEALLALFCCPHRGYFFDDYVTEDERETRLLAEEGLSA